VIVVCGYHAGVSTEHRILHAVSPERYSEPGKLSLPVSRVHLSAEARGFGLERR
jgi:hypothetical protein